MVKVDFDIKLDFSDVLLVPKRSELNSRNDVIIEREFKFKHSNYVWTGVPIIVSNMDTTGTIEMARVLQKYKVLTCLHKFYTADDIPEDLDKNYYMISTGTSQNDLENLDIIIQKHDPHFICIDVANGYHKKFIDTCRLLREKYPNKVLVGGNVVTRELVEELIINGCLDIVKIGIGSGCFSENTRVLMANGTYKNINTIEEGEQVINMHGNPVTVLKVMNQGIKNTIKIKTNNWYNYTSVTRDHNYWIGDLSTSNNDTIQSTGVCEILDKESKTIPEESKYKWKSIDDIDTLKMFPLMPKQISWNLENDFQIDIDEFTNGNGNGFDRYLSSCYDLGYIFGTFLGVNNVKIENTDNSESAYCHWEFGLNEIDIVNKLKDSINKILDCECCSVNIKSNNVYIVYCYSKCLSKVLFEFNKYDKKMLPHKYYCKNIDYIKGIYDGLIDSNGSIYVDETGSDKKSLTNTNIYIHELYYWCCINLNISFCSTNNENTRDNLKHSYTTKTHTLNRETKDYIYSTIVDKCNNCEEETWDIEVDCPTHSFIANNSIVHNSVCTTRLQTGVGFPQFSAVLECADAAHGIDGHIISDGGIQNVGDISKAFGGGADFVMCGSMFAGHDESGGELATIDNKQYKIFYGMSSSTAMNKYHGGVAHYRSAEGKTVKVVYKGPVEETIKNILGGVRSTMTYIGAKKIKHMPRSASFIRVNNIVNKIYNGNEV